MMSLLLICLEGGEQNMGLLYGRKKESVMISNFLVTAATVFFVYSYEDLF